MIWKLTISFCLFANLCLGLFTQTLEKPQVFVDSLLFTDSTRVVVSSTNPNAKILMEIGKGNSALFREITGSFHVSETQALRFKCTHSDYEDSDVFTLNVFKKSDLAFELINAPPLLSDGIKGDYDKDKTYWQSYDLDLLEFKFYTEAKRLEEVELLSLVNPKEHILPPKKVSLYAQLKNGKKIHIRTANTFGKFEEEEQFWSHSLRLLGKPKLKKILRKTQYFSLTITPHVIDGESQLLYFDELLVR